MHRIASPPDGRPVAPLDARAALTTWNIEPLLVLALGVTAAVYLRGWRRLRARRAERIGGAELGAFVGGLVALFLALASPLDTLADRLLAVHMMQHIVLLVVAPPLLLLGAPTGVVLHGLPAGRSRAALAALSRLADRLAHPAVCWLAMALVTWGWHVPAAFELALHHRAWHIVEHLCFLAAGLLFWWPVVQPWPSRPRWPRVALIPYLVLADVQNTALAAILTFSDRVLYPSYGTDAAALDGQVVAGLLMWVPMALVYLVPAAVLTVRWLSESRTSASSRARISDARGGRAWSRSTGF